MSNSQLQKVANNTVVRHFTDSENERHMTVQMPNGNSLHVNTTTGRVVSTIGNRVEYHGILTVLQFMQLEKNVINNLKIFIVMAERYNYYENVKDDIRNELEYYDIEVDEDNIDDVYEEMYDNLRISDSVTGNASGSYTFNTWQAEENIAHNLDLLQEALENFGGDFDLRRGAEYFDVTIRCYLLGQALREVLEEMI